MQNGQPDLQWASAGRLVCLGSAPHQEQVGAPYFLACTHMQLWHCIAHAVQVCVVSRGSKPCLVGTRNGEHFSCDPPEVTVVDTVGAGDCFAAGFLHAYIRGSSLQVTPYPQLQ